MTMWEKLLKTLAAVVGAIAGFFGEWTILLTALCLFMSIDFLTGWIVAKKGKSPKSETGGLSSKAGFDGLIRKFFIILVVLVATILDRVAGNQTAIFQAATCCWYIANEGLSIIENVGLMGVKVPAILAKVLDALKKNGDEPPDGAKMA